MRRIALLFIFCLVIHEFTYAQSKIHPLIPQSPNAASIGKGSDVQVSYYTGQISQTIPLLTIQFNDFSFPINLTYSSSGLKVHEAPSWVGMGWTLNATGVINRQVRGVPDEMTHGFNGIQPTGSIIKSITDGGYTPTTSYSSISKEQFKKQIAETNYDGEPDFFNFNFGSYGGKFFFDETQVNGTQKNAIFIPRQAIGMTATFNRTATQLFNPLNNTGRIDKFVFIDEQGVTYTFDKREGGLVDDDEYMYGRNIVNAWYLSLIETPNGNKLSFVYTQRQIDLPHAIAEKRYLYESVPANTTLDLTPTKDVTRSTTTETVLQEIVINEGNWGKVVFVEADTERTDWGFSSLSPQKPKALKEVKLLNKSAELIKKFTFSYVSEVNRLLLRQVQEWGSDGTSKEPYIFNYHDESAIPLLPYEGSDVIFQEDHWGYYNTNSTGTLLPSYEVTTVNGAGVAEKMTGTAFESYQKLMQDSVKAGKLSSNSVIRWLSSSSYYTLTGTNRNPDYESSLKGQLIKVTYPTKGYTSFTYEANQYQAKQGSDGFNPCSGTYETIKTATKTLSSSAIGCPMSTNQSFTVGEGQYSCFLINWTMHLTSPGQDIIDGEVRLTDENGSIVLSESLSCNQDETQDKNGNQYILLASGTYTLTATICREVAGVNTSSVSINVQGIPTNPSSGTVYENRTGGGVRIKEIKHCATTNAQECQYEEFTYQDLTTPTLSSGYLVTEPKYAYPVEYAYYRSDGGAGTTRGTVNATVLFSNSQLAISTTLGHYIGYNYVKVQPYQLNSAGEKQYNGSTLYDYNSPHPLEYADYQAPSFPFFTLSYDWQRGGVQETKVFNQSNDWVSHNLHEYQTKNSQNYNKKLGIKTGLVIHNLSPSDEDNAIKYAFVSYPYKSGFQYVSQTTEREQFKDTGVGSAIESITNFTYGNDSHLRISQTTSTNSKGESVSTTYTYPHDINSGELLPSATALLSKGMRGVLLQKEAFVNGSSTHREQNFFSTFNGLVLPSTQKTFVGGSSQSATETQQIQYDNGGNLVSFKQAGGATQSFLWGYEGQYPVIHLTNGEPIDPNALLTVSDPATINATAQSLRVTLPQAHVAMYHYLPWIGVSKMIAPNDRQTTFDYDGLGRLQHIKDHQGNIDKGYQYQFGSTLGESSVVKELFPRLASTALPSDYTQVQTTATHIDGLGRTWQTVLKQASPTGTTDIVSQALTYDGLGRIQKTYIPFTHAGSGAIATLPTSVHGDTHPYSQPISYDDSPLNRVLQVQGVGQAWATAGKMTKTTTEIVGSIRQYNVATDGSVSSSTYPANSLYKQTQTDEQGNQIITYTDKDGKLIQKEVEESTNNFLKTAYIYNDMGQLCYVVQPQVYEEATSFTTSSATFSNGIFGYEYDAKGRLKKSHVPAGGWTYLVYDKLNRKVLEQSEQQRTDNRWSFTKYDAWERIIMQGEATFGGSQEDLQASFEDITVPYETWESYHYSAVSFPTSTSSEEKYWNFYDNYDWRPSEIAFNAGTAYQPSTYYSNTKGLLTGNFARSNEDVTKVFHSANYYDYKGRIIQTYQVHHKGGAEPFLKPTITNYDYGFAGEITKEKKTYQTATEANRELEKQYVYDHWGRKTAYTLHLGNYSGRRISNYEYDGVGRLQRKVYLPNDNFQVGGTPEYIYRPPNPHANIDDIASKAVCLLPGTLIDAQTVGKYSASIGIGATGTPINGLQKIDYAWHIRGGLLGINLDNAGNPIPTANEGDLFSYKLDYETANQWNGNIGKESWKTNKNTGTNREYSYDYDKANRLKSATYSGGMYANESYNVQNISYDKNGNILTFWRKGMTAQNDNLPSGFDYIDKMQYLYTGNRLQGITDEITGNIDVGDFRDNGSNADYTYYADGSLKSDANRGISLIEWDTFLKKIKQISYNDGRWIKHFYDGTGRKFKSVDSENVLWEYIDNAVYKNDVLYQLNDDEGRILFENGEYTYEFAYKDHLGNTRVSFKAVGNQLTETQENAYYPFGMSHTGTDFTLGIKGNNFLYNGKEKINSFGLNYSDYGFRTYDLLTNRFISSDPLADKFPFLTNYQYASNNPIVNIDLDGLEGLYYTEKRFDGTDKQIIEKNVVVLTQKLKDIPVGATEKQVSKIQRQNQNIERSNIAKVATIKSELNSFYSNAQDGNGNAVDFRFNIIAKEDNVNPKLSESERNMEYAKISKENGLEGSQNGINLIVPAAVVTRESTSQQGLTTGAKIIRMGNAPDGGIAHEVIHTFGLPDNGYTKGGILNSPPQGIISSEVKQIKQFSYGKRN